MADGTYERRGPREAELKRLQRILAEQAKKRAEANSVLSSTDSSSDRPARA